MVLVIVRGCRGITICGQWTIPDWCVFVCVCVAWDWKEAQRGFSQICTISFLEKTKYVQVWGCDGAGDWPLVISTYLLPSLRLSLCFWTFPPGGKREWLGALKPPGPGKFMKMRRSATSAPLKVIKIVTKGAGELAQWVKCVTGGRLWLQMPRAHTEAEHSGLLL